VKSRLLDRNQAAIRREVVEKHPTARGRELELRGQEHFGHTSGCPEARDSGRNRRALFASQRAKPFDLAVLKFQ
jgi:hypothetical protein